MATHHETTSALDISVAWLANHEHQAETLLREARSLAATVLSGASAEPGGAANFGQCLDDYSRSFIRMIHHLKSMVMCLQTIGQQHGHTSSPTCAPAPATVPAQVNVLPAVTAPDVDDSVPALTAVQAAGSSPAGTQSPVPGRAARKVLRPRGRLC